MNISELKAKAREVLRYSYWWSVLVSFIFAIVCGGGRGAGSSSSSQLASEGGYGEFSNLPLAVWVGIITVAVIFILIGAAIAVFVSNPVRIGHNSFYIKAALRDVRFGHMADGFRYNYKNNVKTMFLYDLYIALWSFLFSVIMSVIFLILTAAAVFALNDGTLANMTDALLDGNDIRIMLLFALYITLWSLMIGIPIYIKKCQYFMVEYIIAENPEISSKRAFEISKKTMKGQKFNVFVLDVSFIGWVLLGILACCIGVHFVMPYYYAARTQCYFYLKEIAVRNGVAEYGDFSPVKDPNIF
ncbi:MAG: DUF975 family protein [Oscillospiraceae bacterium]|nr:DUF975 family protein [Oscillospiraceae bacterium]